MDQLQGDESLQPFPFQKLPTELRHITYDFYFRSIVLKPRSSLPEERPKTTLDGISILLLNRQIHAEASCILSTKFHIEIDISPDAINYSLNTFKRPCKETSRSNSQILSNDGTSSSTATGIVHGRLSKSPITLRIDWNTLAHHHSRPTPNDDQRRTSEVKESLSKTTTEAINVLLTLPSLGEIHIAWKAPRTKVSSLEGILIVLGVITPAWPPAHKIPVLLRPLKTLRENYPGVVVRMPEGSPVGSEELARSQIEGNELREMREDWMDIFGEMDAMTKRWDDYMRLERILDGELGL